MLLVWKSSTKVESLLLSKSDQGSMMQAGEINQSAPNDSAAHTEKYAKDGGQGTNEGRRKKVVVVGLGMVGITFM